MTGAQTWDPRAYDEHASFVPQLGLAALELLDCRPGERILDLGCGDGTLSVALIERGARVVGVDSSPQMVAAARDRGVDARVADGHALTFDAEFDAVFSNAALHWMTSPGDVLVGVARALVPGGRFIGELGGRGNIAAVTDALLAALTRRGVGTGPVSPWYFPTVAEYSGLLMRAGFTVDSAELVERPTALPGDLRDWLATFARPFVTAVAQRERDGLVDEVVEHLEPVLRHADGTWILDYVRLRFATHRGAAAPSSVDGSRP